MAKIPVFLDTDVLVAALLSATGASFALLHHASIKTYISSTIEQEFIEVIRRLNLNPHRSQSWFDKCHLQPLPLTKISLLKKYAPYVIDPEDAHVVAASHLAKTRFLLTHNLKHYQVNLIRQNLNVIVLKPGIFLQYLRSLT